MPRTALRIPAGPALLLVLILVFALASRSQGGVMPGVVPGNQFTWVRALDGGGNSIDVAHSVVFDPQGDMIIGGSITNSTGEQLFAVTKLDPTGQTLLWQQTLRGDQPTQNECRSVAIDAQGNIAATGAINDVATGLDLVAMKWGPAGNPIWNGPQSLPSYAGLDDAGDAVRMDSVGNVIVAGYTSTMNSGKDFTVAKFAGSDGVLVWTYREDGGALTGEEAFALTTVPGIPPMAPHGANPPLPTTQDDVIAVGTLGGSQYFYAVRLEGGAVGPDTVLEWNQQLGAAAQQPMNEAHSVAADPNGDVLIAGVMGSVGNPDFALAKLMGPLGIPVWVTQTDGEALAPDAATQVVSDSQGNAVASGYFTDPDGVHFAAGVFAAADGNPNWVQYLDGTDTSNNHALAIAVDGSDAVIAAGYLQDGGGLAFTAAKWDPAGNPLWTRQARGSLGGNDAALGVAVDSRNNVGVVGILGNTTTGADAGLGYVDQQPPDLAGCFVDQNVLPPSGGTANLFAKIHDNIQVLSATATIVDSSNSTTDVSLAHSTDPMAGPDDWTAALSFPANTTPTDQVYQLRLVARDGTGNTTAPVTCGTVTVSRDATPPAVTNPSVQPTSLPAAGGSVVLAVTATDDGTLENVIARVTRPDNTEIGVPLELGGSNRYSGTYTAPTNNTTSPQTYKVRFVATDQATNSTTLDGGSFVVAAPDQVPPAITNCQVTPRSLEHAGGPVLIQADVTDNVAVGSVLAHVSFPDSSTQDLAMVDKGGNSYSVVFNVPANNSPGVQGYGVAIQAKDTSGNPTQMDCGSITVNPADTTPPVLSNCALTPGVLPSSGGIVTVSVDATDNVGLATVYAAVTRPDHSIAQVSLAPVGGTTYRGTFPAPANPAGTPQLYSVEIRATDTSGNPASVNCGTFQVAAVSTDHTPPVLTDCAPDPATVPYTGGAVVLSVTATDDVAVGSVVARVFGIGGTFTDVPLTPLSGSSYQGVYTAPPNAAATPVNYNVRFLATDTSGNTASLTCSFAVDRDRSAPTISNVRATPDPVPGAGGVLTVSADVSDPSGVGAVRGVVTLADGSVHSFPLIRTTGSSYAGTFTVPANGTALPQTLQAGVTAQDALGNTGSQVAGDLTQGVVSSGRLSLSTDHIDFGKVHYGTRLRGHVTLRNTAQNGAPLIVTISPLLDPFGVGGGPGLSAPSRTRAINQPVSITLAPGQSYILDVSFAPPTTQAYQDMLQLRSTDPRRANPRVRVKGIGCRFGRSGEPM